MVPTASERRDDQPHWPITVIVDSGTQACNSLTTGSGDALSVTEGSLTVATASTLSGGLNMNGTGKLCGLVYRHGWRDARGYQTSGMAAPWQARSPGPPAQALRWPMPTADSASPRWRHLQFQRQRVAV